MDTSETYIKMRRKAISDLGMGNPPAFSYGAEVHWLTTFVCTDIKGDFYYSTQDEQFQLERQDQLQAMINIEYFFQHQFLSTYFSAMIEWREFLGIYRETGYWENFTSFEQLLLALVFKEKYNKVWNGTDWVLNKVLVEQ